MLRHVARQQTGKPDAAMIGPDIAKPRPPPTIGRIPRFTGKEFLLSRKFDPSYSRKCLFGNSLPVDPLTHAAQSVA